MFEYLQNNTWSVSMLVGFFAFTIIASKFCHFGINQAKDKGVAPLCLVISALCGVVLTVFVHVLLSLAH
jgi:hypothetical protein